MALSAVLGWYFRGEQSDPYAAISRSYDDLIPAQAGGKSADPFDHLIPAPKAPKLAPEPENPYASLIPRTAHPLPRVRWSPGPASKRGGGRHLE